MRNFKSRLPSVKLTQKLKPLVLPIDLPVPGDVAEAMSLTQLRKVRGCFWLRFCPLIPPAIGHTITYKGHRWLVTGINHSVQVLGSPAADSFPAFEVEYLEQTKN